MQVADERRFSSAPRFRQIFEFHGDPPDPRPTGVQQSGKSAQHGGRVQDFHDFVEAHIHPGKLRHAKYGPRRTRREKQEADNSKPHRGNPIESSHGGIGVAKREQRCGQKADRQHS